MNTNDPGKAIAAAFFDIQAERAERLKTAIAKIKKHIQQDDDFAAAVTAIMHDDECTENEAKSRAWLAGPEIGQQIISDFIETHGATVE
jgi:hypothetical protein